MNIQLFKATADDAENLVSIQEKAFKKLYDIYTGIRDIKNEKLTLAIYEKVIKGVSVIREVQLERCAAVIRESFATVANEFGLTEQSCPNHTSFIKVEKLQNRFKRGCLMFGYFSDGKIVGYL